MADTEAELDTAGAAPAHVSAGDVSAVSTVALADGVLVRVRTLLPEFTGALRRVAEQVLADPAAAARATIVELAERSGTSPATVTRFCRALGFDGYADLRLGIAAETGLAARSAGWTIDIGREIQPGDPLERYCTRSWRRYQGHARDRRPSGPALGRAGGAGHHPGPAGGHLRRSSSALVGRRAAVLPARIGVAAWSDSALLLAP